MTTKKRKLRAILFADIVGYTSLMQKDEAHASVLLQKFRNILNEQVTQHEGQVINNYGDGCLCTFESAVDAVKCAKIVQLIFQKEPIVPVRIGLHSGDVFFEDNNVFGDSVNIASRIESLGIAGAVLFSKQIKRHISNQTAFEVQSLGDFDFKNVEKTMEVFALANEGLIIPKKNEIKGKLKEPKKSKNKWLLPLAAISLLLISYFLYLNNFSESKLPDEILNARIAVIPFENKTNDTLLNVLGNLTADCITRNLTNLEDTKITQYDNVQQNLKLLKTAPKQFAKLTGAAYLIQGRYYKEGNELIFESRITEPATNEIVHTLNSIRGEKDQPSKLVSELAQRVTGYFALKKSEILNVATNAPKYEAFLQYNKGVKIFGKNYNQAKSYFDQAIQLDSSFIAPYQLVAYGYLNRGQGKVADSLLQIIKKQFPHPPKFEGYWIDNLTHTINGDLEKEFQATKKLFDIDPKNFMLNYAMGYTAIRFNRPQEAIRAFEVLDHKSIQSEGQVKYWWFDRYAEALILLGKHEEALQLLNDFPKGEILQNFSSTKALTFVLQNQQDSLHLLMEDMENNGIAENQILSVLYKIAFDFGAKGDKTNQMLWGKRMLERIQNRPESVELPLIYLGNAYFITEDYEKMLNTYERLKQQYGETWEYLVHVGFAYAKMGNEAKANEFIEKYKKLETPFSRGQFKYAQAIVYAGMDKKEEAMRFLNLAFKEGYGFGTWGYNFSYELSSLRGYPPFEAFVKPKG